MSLSLWLFGLVLGMRHALEPDHLAAVSTLVAERRTGSGAGVVLGGIWGVGHAVALLAVAVLLGWAGAAMPPRVALTFELAVAFMLIAIGARSLLVASRQRRRAMEGGGGRPTAHAHAPRWR